MGTGHILSAHGAKAKRISYSTSHAETLAAIAGLETSSLVSLRLAELLLPEKKPSLQKLAALQEKGVPFLPVDAYTDCRDFFSLTTGSASLPQDKSQRIYILAHREARLSGRLRWVIIVPTQSMLADALTKVMISKQLLHTLTTGEVCFRNEENHPIEARRLPQQEQIAEEDLELGDEKILDQQLSTKEIQLVQHYVDDNAGSYYGVATSRTSSSRPSMWLLTFLCLATVARSAAGGAFCPVSQDENAICTEEISENVSQKIIPMLWIFDHYDLGFDIWSGDTMARSTKTTIDYATAGDATTGTFDHPIDSQ